MKIVTKKKISLTLKLIELKNKNEKYVGGGIGNSSKHLEDELWVQMFIDRESKSRSALEIISTPLQLHLGGTRRAYEELGTFLLALSQYKPHVKNYSMPLDLMDIEENPGATIVIHLPVDSGAQKTAFLELHNVAKATISKDGKSVVEKTFGRKVTTRRKK